MPRGQPESPSGTRKPAGCIVILIEDNGCGIPGPDKEKSFERGYAGYGSGLFVAREILSITGILIRETGTAGTGARFEIFVPDGAFMFVTHDRE